MSVKLTYLKKSIKLKNKIQMNLASLDLIFQINSQFKTVDLLNFPNPRLVDEFSQIIFLTNNSICWRTPMYQNFLANQFRYYRFYLKNSHWINFKPLIIGTTVQTNALFPKTSSLNLMLPRFNFFFSTPKSFLKKLFNQIFFSKKFISPEKFPILKNEITMNLASLNLIAEINRHSSEIDLLNSKDPRFVDEFSEVIFLTNNLSCWNTPMYQNFLMNQFNYYHFYLKNSHWINFKPLIIGTTVQTNALFPKTSSLNLMLPRFNFFFSTPKSFLKKLFNQIFFSKKFIFLANAPLSKNEITMNLASLNLIAEINRHSSEIDLLNSKDPRFVDEFSEVIFLTNNLSCWNTPMYQNFLMNQSNYYHFYLKNSHWINFKPLIIGTTVQTIALFPEISLLNLLLPRFNFFFNKKFISLANAPLSKNEITMNLASLNLIAEINRHSSEIDLLNSETPRLINEFSQVIFLTNNLKYWNTPMHQNFLLNFEKSQLYLNNSKSIKFNSIFIGSILQLKMLFPKTFSFNLFLPTLNYSFFLNQKLNLNKKSFFKRLFNLNKFDNHLKKLQQSTELKNEITMNLASLDFIAEINRHSSEIDLLNSETPRLIDEFSQVIFLTNNLNCWNSLVHKNFLANSFNYFIYFRNSKWIKFNQLIIGSQLESTMLFPETSFFNLFLPRINHLIFFKKSFCKRFLKWIWFSFFAKASMKPLCYDILNQVDLYEKELFDYKDFIWNQRQYDFLRQQQKSQSKKNVQLLITDLIPDPSKYILEMEKASKYYLTERKVNQIFQNVSLKIKHQDFVVILGPSGSGKTTLLNIMAGLDRVDTGDVVAVNKNLTLMNSDGLTLFRRKYVGVIFQRYNLLQNLTGLENIEIGAYLADDFKKTIPINELLKNLEITKYGNFYSYQLSGGQQQRFSIARAIAKGPSLLFCDEPTGALDQKMSRKVLKTLLMINKKYKTTIIMVTHNENFAQLANTVIRFKDGKVTKIDTNKTRIHINKLEI